MSIAAVQARIAELRAQFETPVPPMRAEEITAATRVTSAQFTNVLEAAETLLSSSTPASNLNPNGPTGNDFVESAKKYLGVPYVWGGESLSEGGLDCSGLVYLAMKDIGGPDMPRVARDQQKVGELIPSLDQAKPGDLVFFNTPATHVGIYVGNGQMLDAPKPGKNVTIRDVYETPSTIRRVLPDAPATTTGTSTVDVNRAAMDLVTALRSSGLLNGATA